MECLIIIMPKASLSIKFCSSDLSLLVAFVPVFVFNMLTVRAVKFFKALSYFELLVVHFYASRMEPSVTVYNNVT